MMAADAVRLYLVRCHECAAEGQVCSGAIQRMESAGRNGVIDND